MKLNELEIDTASRTRSPDTESDDLTLTQFSDDDEIDPELRELSEEILKAESAVHARMILSLYFPQYNWGGQQV